MMRQILPKGRKPHIGIIGAGVAGLRCADILTQHGAKVTILEGRDRIGGRVFEILIDSCETCPDKMILAMPK
jgi:phytoene dehydrogenase-like protein